MKIIAYTALHYGKDYLESAMQSVIDCVDEFHILYTSQGSHGTRIMAPCPETADELFEIAGTFGWGKVHWHTGAWSAEGKQRDFIHQLSPDADIILVVDADEIWSPKLVDAAIGLHGDKDGPYRLRAPMVHFWRSFNRAVLHDPAFPERVIYPKKENKTVGGLPYVGVISHMGYAQRPEIVEYKMKIHGHLNELRTDVDWFQDVYMNPARSQDLHPIGSDYWNAEAVNPWDYLPQFMMGHPYAYLEIIE